jgi:hypothetical protein
MDGTFPVEVFSPSVHNILTMGCGNNGFVRRPLSSGVAAGAVYEQATSLKVESLARGRPGNEISARQWEILISPDRNLLGGFLSCWEKESALSEAFIGEERGIVADAFDTTIGLESGAQGLSGSRRPGQ